MERVVEEYYMANDGSKFEYADECRKYELSFHPSVKMWKYKPDFNSPIGTIGMGEETTDFEAAYFIVASEDDTEYVEEMAFDCGISRDGLDFEGDADAFMWNEAAGEWKRVSDIIEDLTAKLAYYKSIYNKMMEE